MVVVSKVRLQHFLGAIHQLGGAGFAVNGQSSLPETSSGHGNELDVLGPDHLDVLEASHTNSSDLGKDGHANALHKSESAHLENDWVENLGGLLGKGLKRRWFWTGRFRHLACEQGTGHNVLTGGQHEHRH